MDVGGSRRTKNKMTEPKATRAQLHPRSIGTLILPGKHRKADKKAKGPCHWALRQVKSCIWQKVAKLMEASDITNRIGNRCQREGMKQIRNEIKLTAWAQQRWATLPHRRIEARVREKRAKFRNVTSSFLMLLRPKERRAAKAALNLAQRMAHPWESWNDFYEGN